MHLVATRATADTRPSSNAWMAIRDGASGRWKVDAVHATPNTP